MKVAIIHDWLNQNGGAERVLEEFHAMYPDAPIYTSMYDAERMPAAYKSWDIRTTWMQRLPMVTKKHQLFMPLFPAAFETIDLSGYDLAISSSSAFCHGVLTRTEACHVCYCHTPTRFIWNYFDYAKRERLSAWKRRLLAPYLFKLRQWDRTSADRVDYWIANSGLVKDRIAKYYRRTAAVIYPPVDTARFVPEAGYDDYYLVLSRLLPYKRIDLAIEACNRTKSRLLIAGSGRGTEQLKKLAGPTVEFLGRVPEEQLSGLYARCKAFIFPGEEDFGLTPLEANAAGRPTIAFKAGGTLDTVLPGVTGEYFTEPTVDSLVAAMTAFNPDAYDPAKIRAHAETFDTKVFRAQFQDFVKRSMEAYAKGIPVYDQ
ncbi:MAG TPA: glycosyltransferase [Armatimonadota bacterium]|jgi:glycosyltransferase involved in cell wall biosynthesis